MTDNSDNESAEKNCSPTECVGKFTHSFAHTLIQGPIDGVREVVNTCSGKNIVPDIKLISKPEKAEYGSPEWNAQRLGSGAGIVSGLFILGNILSGRRRRPF